MSWMDSWSRPSKSQATPPPFYLLPGGSKTPYCKSCGRVIGDRKTKTAAASATPAKYCSSRCKSARHDKAIEWQIEETFVALLNGSLPNSSTANDLLQRIPTPPYKGGPSPSALKRRKKGETRILVQCSEVEAIVFGERNADPEKCFGRRKNRARRGVKDGDVWKSVDMVSDDEEDLQIYETESIKGSDKHTNHDQNQEQQQRSDGEASNDNGGVPLSIIASEQQLDPDVVARLSVRSGTRMRPSQDVSEVNGGIGGEKGVKERISESESMLAKRKEGQKRADERELVRCAARRGVAFGFLTGTGKEDDGGERRLCEAVMLGKVVESSFAKGEWGVRWRE